MNICPTNSPERWLLLIFPFRAYVFLAPICFAVWEMGTTDHRFRGAWADAVGIIVLGYEICFLVFAVAALLFLILRKSDLVLVAGVFALLAILFPTMILAGMGGLVIPFSIFYIGMNCLSHRPLPKTGCVGRWGIFRMSCLWQNRLPSGTKMFPLQVDLSRVNRRSCFRLTLR
jgi:hypothetical protein